MVHTTAITRYFHKLDFVKKSYFYFLLIFGIFFLLQLNTAKAQDSNDLVVGGESVYQKITITNGTSASPVLTNPTILIDLAPGVEADLTSFGLSFSIIGGGNRNSFKIQYNGTCSGGQSIDIEFNRSATCSASNGNATDRATFEANTAFFKDEGYRIWKPQLNFQSFTSAVSSAVIGDKVGFSATIQNDGQHSYVSNFIIAIAHGDFSTPTDIVLKMNGISYTVLPADMSTSSGVTNVKVTSAILRDYLGSADGRFAYIPAVFPSVTRQDMISITYNATLKTVKCDNVNADMKVSTITDCNDVKDKDLTTLTVLSPGFITSSLTTGRRNFDFPDETDISTVNGDWSWNGGSANPKKDYVRNGDSLEIRVQGSIRTSSVFASVDELYASISFDDYNHAEFTWDSQVVVRIKRNGQIAWTTHSIIANANSGSSNVLYKVPAGSLNLQAGDEVELAIVGVMKDASTVSGSCIITVDAYAVNGGTRYPTDPCKIINNETIHRVEVEDNVRVSAQITGSCTPQLIEAKFSSQGFSSLGTPCVNCFGQEFRSNHYVKSFAVYVPEEGTLQSGSIKIDTHSPITLTMPTPTISSNTKCYIFDVAAFYGTYGDNSSIFTDEALSELTASFFVVFEVPVNAAAKTSSIKYVFTPGNPSVPSAVLQTKEETQNVLLPAIYPTLNATTSDVTLTSAGVATWQLRIENTQPNSIALDNSVLQFEPLTGGSFNAFSATQNGSSVTVVGTDKIVLNTIPSGATHVVNIQATVLNGACNPVERFNVNLNYKPCGTGAEVTLAKKALSFSTPKSIVEVSTNIGASLTMCDEFTAKVVVSAADGVVKEPKVELVLPKNSSNAVGITYKGVKINGTLYPSSSPTSGVTIYTDYISFEVKDMPSGMSQLDAGNLANSKYEFDVILEPNCDFPANARLTAYAYGKNFCNLYNSDGSGVPVRTGELKIAGLQSVYTAQLNFGESTLTFDKSSTHKRKTTTLTIRKVNGGNIGSDDVITITMPASFRMLVDGANPVSSLGATETLSGAGIYQERIVVWAAPSSISSTPKEYKLEFIMDTPAAYGDLLNGTISATLINKIQGLPCGIGTCPNIETKAGEGSVIYKIIDLFPALAKDVSTKANSLKDYTFTYKFTLKNFGDIKIDNVRLEDDLSDFYYMKEGAKTLKGVMSGINISSSSPNLIPNAGYNADTDIQLLASGCSLLPGETQTVTLSFNIVFSEDWLDNCNCNGKFTIENTSIVTGSNQNGTDYSNKSNDGTTPDLSDDSKTVTEPIETTPPDVVVEPIITSPPPGFAITTDGVECFEGNTGTFTPLEFEFKLKDGKPLDYDLCFTVYTRDSIAMATDNDFQKILPEVLCIRAGNISADRTITVTIIGDDKYEKDEPFILAVKPGANPMTCKSPVIIILNDDPIPSIIIDEITQPTKDTAVVNLGDLQQKELTSNTELTKFEYCVKLNAVAPQDLVLRVEIGNEFDTAKKGRDYYSSDEIIINIATGEDKVCFIIEVEPDDIPENNEYFSMSFTLEASGLAFYQEVRKAFIIDDDEFVIPNIQNSVLAYCPGDDTTERSRKLNEYVAAPAGYELRWYSSQTSKTQIPEPLMETALPGAEDTYYLGFYNPDEDYTSPSGKRIGVKIIIQSKPLISMVSAPESPMTLFPGQTALFTITPGLVSYDFALNGTSLTQSATSNNEIRVHTNKFIYNDASSYTTNTMNVVVVDSEGCPWDENFDVDVKQVELPNAFIPEGGNDANKIFLKDYDIRVFNRWGHLLYKGTDGWDGRYKGSYVAPGTYYYVLNMQQEDGSIVEVKGHVMVVSANKK